jgi:hypothetical protein
MGLLDALGRRPRRFVSEDRFRRDLGTQHAENVPVLDLLREQGVSSSRELTVEFLFYTDKQSKADALAADLRRLGYETETRPFAHEQIRYSISGCTPPMAISSKVLDEWCERMVTLAFASDCLFDGWQVDPR